MKNTTATCNVSINVPENVVFVNYSNMPLYWDGVRWSTWNPETKIAIVYQANGN